MRAPERSDVVNAVGAEMTLHRLIATARELTGHSGELVLASDDALAPLDIGHWAGPRALPLTLPAVIASARVATGRRGSRAPTSSPRSIR